MPTIHAPNRRTAPCVRCGAPVLAHTGHLALTPGGGWAADHIGPCPSVIAVAVPVRRPEHPGTFIHDGATYKVVDDDGTLRAFTADGTPAPGVVHTLTEDERVGA